MVLPNHPDGCPCRLCWLEANDPRYANLGAYLAGDAPRTYAGVAPVPAGGPATAVGWQPPPAPTPRIGALACVHLGVETGEADCPSCGGSVRVKVFACRVYGFCTVAKAVPPLACCEGCSEYRSRTDA